MNKNKSFIEICLDSLGNNATDRVTGFKGIITSVTFDLYGCIQVLVHPGIDDNGKLKDQSWFDINRLIIDDNPVMKRPDFICKDNSLFYDNGPSDKPNFTKS